MRGNAVALARHAIDVANRRIGRSRRGGRDVREDRASVRSRASRGDRGSRVLEGVRGGRDGCLRKKVGHVGLRHRHHSRLESRVALVIRLDRRSGDRGGSVDGSGGLGEPRATLNQIPKFGKFDSSRRVGIEDPPQNGIQLVRDGKNGPQEVGVLHESAEGRVLQGGLLPRVAATGQVDEDDAQRPYVIGCRLVGCVSLGIGLLAFCDTLASAGRDHRSQECLPGDM